VKKIVEDNGGTVWVDSKGVPGEGTAFRFTWPKRKEETNGGKVGDNPAGGR
jgi:signal transduction histidine kinase